LHLRLTTQKRYDASLTLAVPGGTCVVTKRLPERDGEFEYRIKSINEPHERVVRESQLERTDAL
jgi:hypothetical protein